MKKEIFNYLDKNHKQLLDLSDYIFDHPEADCKEYKASEALCNYLKQHGFSVELGIGGLDTAFRATYSCGSDGPSIGLLCEYDALENIGHACGHHMQGPAILGAALALKQLCTKENFKLVIYGTPAEETSGGKIIMIENGCFDDIDVALMFHPAPTTTVDVRSLALSSFKVTFRGISSHAAIAPEKGRSSFDALLLAFNAIEYLREHVKEDTRMHYTVLSAGGPDNIVPSESVATFNLRSYNRSYLDTVVKRFIKILDGAALMTETEYEIESDLPFDSKIPVNALNDLLINNAHHVNAPTIRPPRIKTGSTDFGNLMYRMPGSCIRVAFVPEGTPPHSETYLLNGKSEDAHNAIVTASKILAATCYDLIRDKNLLLAIQEEFKLKKVELNNHI